MVYKLLCPAFEEYDADSMVRRSQSGWRIFCDLTEKHCNCFAGSPGLTLHVLERCPKLVIKLRVLPNESDRAELTLSLEYNKVNPEAGAHEDRESP